MPHRSLSLRLYLAGAFLAAGGVLVAGYSLLSADYFVRGMDSVVSAWLEEAAEHYLENVPVERRKHTGFLMGNILAPTFEQLPDAFRQAFAEQPPKRVNHLQQNHRQSRWRTPDDLYFLMHYRKNGEEVFVGRLVDRASASPLVQQQKVDSAKLLVMVSLVVACVLGLVIWLLLRQVSKPMVKLEHWTRRLTPAELTAPVPDFTYPELNGMARLIRSSLSSVQDTLEREQRFLRHASHELRTPISVIRSNVELMNKIQSKESCVSKSAVEQQVMERIDRASLTMKHLTETLLWLGRDDEEPLPVEDIKPGEMLEIGIDILRYLLNDKDVTVSLQTDDTILRVAAPAVKIVIGNLIRNAFQHTWRGEVKVIQIGTEVRVSNPIPQATNAGGSDPGFGLGLQLTERLTKRLGWHYECETVDGMYHATVRFSAMSRC